MRWTSEHNHWLAKQVLSNWKESAYVDISVDDTHLLQEINQILNRALDVDQEIEQEARALLDQLEESESGQFDRRKMYGLLKQKLAEKKGVVL